MTILIALHQSGYRTFKHFYLKHVCVYWRAAFPTLVSYTRWVQLKKELKTQTQVEHSRHRSVENFHVNVFSALIAYQLLEKKPTLNLAELQTVSDLPVIF